MEFLASLWLPIVAAAVAMFIASSIAHMALPHHRSNFGKLPGEDAIAATMRQQGIRPGQYMLPMPASMKDMASPEMKAKFESGPVARLTVMPNRVPSMGNSLIVWFVYGLVVCLFVGYVGWFALGPGAAAKTVFRLTGSIAVLAYGTSYVHNSIWEGAPWSIAFKFVADGVVYGLLTGLVFAWLWPAA